MMAPLGCFTALLGEGCPGCGCGVACMVYTLLLVLISLLLAIDGI